MLAPFYSEHWDDDTGNPGGGVTSGRGLCISWQHGPLGRENERREPNGAFVETVIAAVKDRLAYYQTSEFACRANADALMHLEEALISLDNRTKDREHRQVEGTHAV